MLLPTAYLPPVSWCSAFWNVDSVLIEPTEHYQKGSLRNRAHIAGPNGVQRLSIPLVKGKHQQTPIREVRISYHDAWQRQHWRSIQTAYGNAPYFEHYAGGLRRFYEEPFEFLYDYNLELLRFILVKKMGWRGTIQTETPVLTPTENLAALAKRVALPSPADSATMPRYPQVFEEKHGFIADLSVLDLLFCCGKHGAEILEKPTQPPESD